MKRRKLELVITILIYFAVAALSGLISIRLLNMHKKLTPDFLQGNLFTSAILPLLISEAIVMVLTLYDGHYSFRQPTVGFCVRRSFRTTVFFAGVFAAILLIQKNSVTDSRYYFVATLCVHFVLLALFIYVVEKYTVDHFYHTTAASRVMLATTSDRAARYSDLIKHDWSRKLAAIALLDYDGKPSDIKEIDHIHVTAGRDNLVKYVQQHAIDEVFLIVDNNELDYVTDAVKNFIQMGIQVHLNLPSIERLDEKITGANEKYVPKILRSLTYFYNDTPILTMGTPEPKMRYMFLKRLFDIIGAIIGCIITFVLFIIFGIAIKIDSPGPIFFKQDRIGKNGRHFKMYKFRSMYIDAEERKKALMEQNEMNGFMFKMKDDPRITRVGKFIRKTSIDEFPQFFNVLKGDMSLVGTRPPTVDEFRNYSNYHKRRLSMKPGITGMWQVSGRSDITDFEEIVRLDCEYIDNWSLWLDVKILFKTIGAVLSRKGSE